MPKEFHKMSLDELADHASADGTPWGMIVRAEFAKRSTRAQILAARSMMASVIVLALSSIANLMLTHWPI